MKKLWSNINKKWSIIKKYWKQVCVITVLVVIGILFYLTLKENTEASGAIIAFGTLILALVTALSILNAVDREKSDRKERLLNEIIDWAEDMANIETYLTDLCESVRLDKDKVFSKSCEQLYYEIEGIRLKGEYIKIISEKVLSDSLDLIFKLHKHITKITFLLEGFIYYQDIVGVDLTIITTDDVNGIDTNPDKDTIAKHLVEIDPLCRAIIEEVTRNKISGIS